MQAILTTAQMRFMDENCTAFIPTRELIKKAAKAVFLAYKPKGKSLIVAGKGNNGADGLALALLLKENKLPCAVLLVHQDLHPEAAYYCKECQLNDIPLFHYNDDFDFTGYDTIYDCLYGIGFKGEFREKQLTKAINSTKAFIIAVDINSGLNSDNGLGPEAIRADLTLAINYYKPGHFLNDAKDLIKKLNVVDIGIPLTLKTAQLIEKDDLKSVFYQRKNNSHKGSYGYSVLIGGSKKYSGAAKLANLALSALRSGTGVNKLAVPENIADYVLPYLLEATLFPLAFNQEGIVFKQTQIDELLKNTCSCGIGMGIGRSTEIKKLLEYLLSNYPNALIIDADGLNVLSTIDSTIIKNRKAKLIITPHPLEFARLLKTDVRTVLENPLTLAQNYAREYNCIVLLKGTCTVITDGQTTFLSATGAPGMATAGSGDVLSGIITALCGYNQNNLLKATAAGAYINGLAGQMASEYYGDIAMIASDTVAMLPQAIKSITN